MEEQLDAEARINALEVRYKKLESDLASATVALTNDKFSANVYRKAIEHEVKEHVYGKILKAVSIVGLVAGFGLSVGFYARIQSQIATQVQNEIRSSQDSFVSAGDELTRDNLMLLISQILPQGENQQWALSEITGSRRQTFSQILRSVIEKPTEEYERTFALRFAAQNRLPELAPTLMDAFQNEDLELGTRLDAFRGLLISSSNTQLAGFLDGYAANSAGRDEPLTLQMMRELARSEVDPDIVDAFLQGTDAVMNDENTLMAVNAFYLRNQGRAFAAIKSRYDLSGLDSRFYRFFNATSDVIDYGSRPEVVTAELIAAAANTINAELQKLAQSYSDQGEDFSTLKLYGGYALLRLGDKSVAENNALFGTMFPESILEDIRALKLFPQYMDFLAELHVPLSEQSTLLQGHLYDFLSDYEWNNREKSYRYAPAYADSATDLKMLDELKSTAGEIVQISLSLSRMAPWDWTRNLVTQFPDAASEVPFFSPAETRLTGTLQQQYSLSNWFYGTSFKWDGSAAQFRKVAIEDYVLAELRTGNREPYLQNMYSNSFDSQVWTRDVLSLFPQAASELWPSSRPSGTEDDQYALYSWVSNEIVDWEPASSTYRAVTQALAIERLRTGDRDLYLRVMERGVFEQDSWIQTIYPLFPEAPALVFSDASVTGLSYEQDMLWFWVRENEFRWSGTAYTLIDSAELL